MTIAYICDNRPFSQNAKVGLRPTTCCLKFFAVSDLFGCANTDEKEASSIA